MPCAECTLKRGGTGDTYTVTGEMGTVTIDVSMAKRIVSDGRESHLFPDSGIDDILWVNQVCEEHIDHVDPTIPGILGWFKEGILAIDGTHRAARCKRDKLPYRVYLMNEMETAACVIDYQPDNKEGIPGINR